MTGIDITAVDSDDEVGTLVHVSVDGGDDIIDLAINRRATAEALGARLTVAEALATIAALTQAVQVALGNS